jgi:multidrug efflux pump subunit AcrA (membrane-fusion protein)
MPTAVPPRPIAAPFPALEQALGKLLAGDTTPESFAEQWLRALVNEVQATAGRLRRPAADGTLGIVAAIAWPQPPETAAPEQGSGPSAYERFVAEVYATGRSKIIPAGASVVAVAPADQIVIAPLVLEDQLRGTIELLLPGEAPPDHSRRALEAIALAAAAYAHYERRRRERTLAARQQLIDDVERFTRAVHERLELQHTAYVTANDGRRLIGCDRLTVLLRRGTRYEVTAASGVDSVENRSQAAKLLGRLAATVAAAVEPCWFTGATEALAPQLRDALNDYVEATHVKQVAVVPLLPASEANGKRNRSRPLGALVVEQIEDVSPAAGREERAALVALHVTIALGKAAEHEAIPLLPLWRAVGRLPQLFAPGTRAKTAAIVLALALVAAALKFIRVDFALTAKGTLQPSQRQHVFAPLDATVRAIHVRHGDRVQAGQLLIELRNTELDVTLADVTGQHTAAQEQLLATERALYEDSTKIAAPERHRLAGERSEIKQRLAALDEQLRILRRKREQLRVTSPIAGEVTTWNVDQLLRDRPIRQGQVLLDVADIGGPWELELQVPEDGIGLLLAAQEERGPTLPVVYRLAAEPRTDRTAELAEVQYAAEVRGEEGNTVLARAALIGEPLPPLRPGAEATAKVYCVKRALGYVWLHDAVDFVRTKVWFRMY